MANTALGPKGTVTPRMLASVRPFRRGEEEVMAVVGRVPEAGALPPLTEPERATSCSQRGVEEAVLEEEKVALGVRLLLRVGERVAPKEEEAVEGGVGAGERLADAVSVGSTV